MQIRQLEFIISGLPNHSAMGVHSDSSSSYACSSSSSQRFSNTSTPTPKSQLTFQLSIEGKKKSKFHTLLKNKDKLLSFLLKYHPIFSQMGLRESMLKVNSSNALEITLQGKGSIAGLCRLLVTGREHSLFNVDTPEIKKAQQILKQLGRTQDYYQQYAVKTPPGEVGASAVLIHKGKNHASELIIEGKHHIAIKRPLGRAILDDMAAMSCLMNQLNGVTPKGRVLYDYHGNRTGFASEKVPDSMTLWEFLFTIGPTDRKAYLQTNAKKLGQCVAHLYCIMQDDFHLGNILVNKKTEDIIPIDFDRAHFPRTAKYSTFKDDDIAARYPFISSCDIRSPINPIDMQPNNWFVLNHAYFKEVKDLRSMAIARALPGLDKVVMTEAFQTGYYGGFTEFASLEKADFKKAFSAIRSEKRRKLTMNDFTERAVRLRSVLLSMPEYHQYLNHRNDSIAFVTPEAIGEALESAVSRLDWDPKEVEKSLCKIKCAKNKGPEAYGDMTVFHKLWRRLIAESSSVEPLIKLIHEHGKHKEKLIKGVNAAKQKLETMLKALNQQFQQPVDVIKEALHQHMKGYGEFLQKPQVSQGSENDEHLFKALSALESFAVKHHHALWALDHIGDPSIKEYTQLREKVLEYFFQVVMQRRDEIAFQLQALKKMSKSDRLIQKLNSLFNLAKSYKQLIRVSDGLKQAMLISGHEHYIQQRLMRFQLVMPMQEVFLKLNQCVLPTFETGRSESNGAQQWINAIAHNMSELPFSKVNTAKKHQSHAACSSSTSSTRVTNSREMLAKSNLSIHKLIEQLKIEQQDRLKIEKKIAKYKQYLERRKDKWSVGYQWKPAKIDDCKVPTHIKEQWDLVEKFYQGLLGAAEAWKQIYHAGHVAQQGWSSFFSQSLGYTNQTQSKHYKAFTPLDDDSALMAFIDKTIPPDLKPNQKTTPTENYSRLTTQSHQVLRQ